MWTLRPSLILVVLAFALGVLAPGAAGAAVMTFHENGQFDGALNGATRGGGSGYAAAGDWSALTFLSGADCNGTGLLGANCTTKQVLLVVDSNLAGANFGLGGVAFNFTGTLSDLTVSGSGLNGPNGTPSKASNATTLPNRAGTGARTQGYDVGISWSNLASGAQTFAGQTRSVFLLSVSTGSIGTNSFAATTANGQYAASSIVKCSINCGAQNVVVTAAFDAPEPASLAILGAGLAGLGLIRYRRRGTRA